MEILLLPTYGFRNAYIYTTSIDQWSVQEHGYNKHDDSVVLMPFNIKTLNFKLEKEIYCNNGQIVCPQLFFPCPMISCMVGTQ